ncbi:MAG: GTPase ObgE, partial [Planctomycetaceae bacterium]|nr:GTPase ObgE [Planctomycetaceae bacterium]
VERAGILVHVVEPAPLDGSDPLLNYKKIRQELSLYDESLGARPEIVIVSKSELDEAKRVREQLSSETGLHVLAVSAVTGDGLQQLLHSITKRLAAKVDDKPR